MLNCIVLFLVVQFEFEFSEFEFELNCLNLFQKKCKAFLFSLPFSPLIPAQPNLSSFFFLSPSRAKPPPPAHLLTPAQPVPASPSRSPPTGGARLSGSSPRSGLTRTLPESGAPRFHAAPSAPWRARQGGPAPPYKASPRAPLIP